MHTVLIIEDEEAAVRRLQKMILELMPAANILPSITTIRQAVNWLKTNPMPDLIFSDVHLADGISFEIYRQVTVSCPIIFSTAYDQYALEAFKVNSIDYLLKPVKKEELQRAIDKYLQFTGNPQPSIDINTLLSSLQQPKIVYKDRFVVKYGEHLKTIESAEIAYLYTENKINFLVTTDGRRYAIDYNLDQLEELMDPKKFFRVNRQFIIGFYSIADMFTYPKSRVLIKLSPVTKAETIVSAERSSAFKAWLDGK